VMLENSMDGHVAVGDEDMEVDVEGTSLEH
jgi:hypothetical protein